MQSQAPSARPGEAERIVADGDVRPEAPQAASIAVAVTAQQIAGLYRHTRISNLVTPVNSALVVYIVWSHVPQMLALAWVTAMWLVTGLRVALDVWYRRAPVERRADTAWRDRAVVLIGLAGITWGAGTLLLFPAGDLVGQFFIAMVAVGMSAGGAMALSIYLPAMLAYCVPLIALQVVALALQNTSAHRALAIMSIVYFAALFALARVSNRAFTATIRLGLENADLLGIVENTQRRLEDAIESMADAFAFFDGDDRLVQCNARFRTLVPALFSRRGLPVRYLDFLHALASDGMVQEARGQIDPWVARMLARHRNPGGGIDLRLTDGRWLRLSERRTSEGGVVTIVTDVTELKAREGEARTSEGRFRDFVEVSTDWLWETDASLRITALVGPYQQITGWPVERLLGRRHADIEAPFNIGPWERMLADLAAHRPIHNVHVERTTDDNRVHHFLLNGKPLFDAGGTFLGFRGTGTDMTPVFEAQREAREARLRLFEAVEALPASFLLFDNDDSLVVWNTRAPELLPGIEPLLHAGASYAELMGALAGNVSDAQGRIGAWVAERLQRHAAPEGPQELRLADGRAIQLLERRSASGATVLVGTDVSEIRRDQQDLADKTRLLQTTLESMGEGLIVLDSEQRTVLVNNRLAKLIGLPESLGRTGVHLGEIRAYLERRGDLSRVPAAARPEAVVAAFAAGTPFHFERTLPSGNVLSVRASPMPSGGWVMLFADVTAERAAIVALEESEERYRRLVEALPDIVAVGVAGRLVFVNRAGSRHLGANSAAALVGRRVLDFVHPDHHDLSRATEPAGDPTSAVPYHEIRMLRIDGSPFDAEVAGIRFTYRGQPANLYIAHDITERKLAQAQVVQASKLATLGEMAASLTHELNQPLNIIRLAADASLILMEEGDSDFEYQREQFQQISNQTQRMAQIIDHMRVFNRRDEASSEPFDANASVRQAVRLVEDQYRLDDVTVTCLLPEGPAIVRGHPIRLEQVVLNLLSNGRDAIMARRQREGRPGGAIRVRAYREHSSDGAPGRLRILVSDEGGGIPSDKLAQIFDPFFTTKESGKGTGLGLAIGYSIVSGMGGRIDVRNRGQGAEFEIELPLAPQPAKAPATAPAGMS
ncbi:MAG: PAS-domain containing protein [Alphaproteobacteria bacterium]